MSQQDRLIHIHCYTSQVTTPSTSFNTGGNYWQTAQSIATGATSFSTVTFITAGVVQLPANAAVSSTRLIAGFARSSE